MDAQATGWCRTLTEEVRDLVEELAAMLSGRECLTPALAAVIATRLADLAWVAGQAAEEPVEVVPPAAPADAEDDVLLFSETSDE
jgi:hypothetical protein